MRTFTFFGFLLLVFAPTARGQTRLDQFTSTATSITEIVLNPLPDGGCAARWQGHNVSSDGGTELTAVTPQVELRTSVQQNRCAGLAAAGVPRVNRELRLDPDGGAP